MYDPEGKESEAVEERTVTNRVREIREHKLMTQSQLARKARIALLARREEMLAEVVRQIIDAGGEV